MDEDRFTVVFFDAEGFWDYVRPKGMTAADAVTTAKRLVDLAPYPAGENIHKVMVTDESDFCCLLWERGKGLVFPNREQAHEKADAGDAEGRR